MKRYEQQGRFRLQLPDGWEADEDDEPISFYQPGGAGVLQMTVQEIKLKVGEHLDPRLFLRSFLKQHGVGLIPEQSEPFKVRGGEGVRYEAETSGPDGPLAERVWVLAGGGLILFFTYACRQDEDREGELVEGLINSVRILA